MTFFLKIPPRVFLRSLVAWGDLIPVEEMGTSAPAQPIEAGARLSRHDHHNLEIKAWVEPGSADYETQLDLFFFVPSSFQLTRWSKPDLAQDFHSRVRLALPTRTDEGEVAHRTTRDYLDQARRLLSRSPHDSGSPEPTTDDYKQVGVLISELFKHRAALHRRRFLMSHSLSIPQELRGPEVKRLLSEVVETAELLGSLREIFSEAAQSLDPILPLLDEYLSNFYVQYLGELRTAMNELDPLARERADSVSYREALKEFDQRLAAYQREEAAYRQKFPYRVEHARHSLEQEHSVVRLSQLKKFFQSRMFVDVSRHSPSSRFLETTAILGTALAGLCWAVVQFLNRPDLAQTTNQGIFVMGFAVLAYVLRDRIKDRAKASLHKRLQSWLPDADQQLQADGQTIGSIREWLHLLKRRNLPTSVQLMRTAACRDEIEHKTPEDVLHIRKVFTVHSRAARQDGWALQEISRLNVERYLKFMDDPFKELSLLKDSGELTKLRSRRVYHFHIGVELTSRPLVPSQSSSPQHAKYFYRLVLDKDGIDRLEPITEN